MIGNWKFVEFKSCKLPQAVASGWTKAMDDYVGDNLQPVIYCGEQVVEGTNHMIICKAKSVALEPREYMAVAVLYEGVNGEFSIERVSEIVI